MIHRVNDGPRLLRTSYWQTEHAELSLHALVAAVAMGSKKRH